MKTRIIDCFNQGSMTYDTYAQVQRLTAKRLVQRLSHISPANILEIGCGTGILSEQLLSLFPTSSFLLTDISPEMKKMCQQRFRQYPQISTQCVDGESIVLSPCSFDLIVSSMTFHWFENVNLSLEKFISSLASQGCLAFAMMGENSLSEWQKMCCHFEILSGQINFPNVEKLKIEFPNINFQTEKITQTYASAYIFLNSLKRLGAYATHSQYIMTQVKKLRALLKHYSSEIEISYEIIYGYYKKP